ncbi:MAG: hypothetical protein H6Q10_2074 [Acidobacteria bacterium]|nr:hypothetical protein [Acidobacteriota bacterium]
MKSSTAVAVGLLAVATWSAGGISGQAPDPLRERARALHRQILVLDAHADLGPFFEMDTLPARITDPGLGGPGYDPSADPGRSTRRTSRWPPRPRRSAASWRAAASPSSSASRAAT